MLARELRRLLPVGDDFLLPLPVQHFLVLRRPAVGDPVWLRVVRGPSRTARESNNDRHIHLLRQQHRPSKRLSVSGGMLGIRMNWVPVATERRHPNVAILELLLPSLSLA